MNKTETVETKWINAFRHIHYIPALREECGSINAVLLYCFLMQEPKRGKWQELSSDDLTEFTTLSYKEQRHARKLLVKNNMIEEHYARLTHKMFFRIPVGSNDK